MSGTSSTTAILTRRLASLGTLMVLVPGLTWASLQQPRTASESDLGSAVAQPAHLSDPPGAVGQVDQSGIACARVPLCGGSPTLINGEAYAGNDQLWQTDFFNSTLRLVDVNDECNVLQTCPAPGGFSPSENTLLNGVLYHYDFGTGLLYGINPDTCAVVSTCNPPGDDLAEGLTNDGQFLWKGDSTTLYRFDPATCAIVGTCPNPPFDSADGLSMCGEFLILFGYSGRIYQIDPTTCEIVSSCTLNAGAEGNGIASDRSSRLFVDQPDFIDQVDLDCGVVFGCFALDFETDDTGAAMAHGTKVDTEFDGGSTFPVTITAITNPSGDNTAAILNSSTGPAAQDPDLLVGTGNILILQNDGNQSECPPGSGVYCTHNDDEDGGRIDFVFNAPAAPTSIDLIDVDATDQNWRVVMVDSNGNERFWNVQANWTGDLVTDGPPGMGTLDLTDINPQPGFGSSAIGGEDAGFDGTSVIRVFVLIEGSGGVDNLNWCEPELPLAAATERNGSGVNPVRLTAVSLPVLGHPWSADLDCSAFGDGLATLNIRRQALAGVPTAFGELLVDGTLLQRTTRAFSGSVARLTWQVPSDMALCGLVVHAQGLCQSSGAADRKTFQIRGGLSNALDLTLGF